MLNKLDSSNPVIQAGDLNCWIDKINNKQGSDQFPTRNASDDK
jgi:hypothetical protein